MTGTYPLRFLLVAGLIALQASARTAAEENKVEVAVRPHANALLDGFVPGRANEEEARRRDESSPGPVPDAPAQDTGAPDASGDEADTRQENETPLPDSAEANSWQDWLLALPSAPAATWTARLQSIESIVLRHSFRGQPIDSTGLPQQLAEILSALNATQPAGVPLSPLPPAGIPGALAWCAWAVTAHTAEAVNSRRDQARRDVVYALGLCGAPETAPLLTDALRDPALAEEAVAALMRVPGSAGNQTLLATLDTTRGPLRRSVIAAVAARPVSEAVPNLERLARSPDPAVMWSALAALSRLGVPPSALIPRDDAKIGQDASTYDRLLLHAALVCESRGDGDTARRILKENIDDFGRTYQLALGLRAMQRIGAPGLRQLALGYLNTAGARDAALDILAADPDLNLDSELAWAYTAADPAMQSGLLEALARRGAPALPTLLDKARRSKDPGVRVVAYWLSGMNPLELDLLQVAVNGAPWLRGPAIESFLSIAEARLESGDVDAAVDQFATVAQGPYALESRVRAVRGLGAAGTPGSRALLEKLRKDPTLAAAAGEALVAATAMESDPEKARETLVAIVREADSDAVANAAITQLQSLDSGTEALVEQRGFITSWQVIGPFPSREDTAYAKSFIPETQGDTAQIVEFEGVTFTWQPVTADGAPAVVDLRATFGPYENAVAYGIARIAVPEWTLAMLRVGSTDGCQVWLNGDKIHEFVGRRALRPDEDVIRVNLRPGLNRLLIKVVQSASGPWGFCARLSNRSGAPLDLSAQQMPDDGTKGVGAGAPKIMGIIGNDVP